MNMAFFQITIAILTIIYVPLLASILIVHSDDVFSGKCACFFIFVGFSQVLVGTSVVLLGSCSIWAGLSGLAFYAVSFHFFKYILNVSLNKKARSRF